MSIKYHYSLIIMILIMMIGFSSCFGMSHNTKTRRLFMNHQTTRFNHNKNMYHHRQQQDQQQQQQQQQHQQQLVFNVVSFGAKGDGKTDDSMAFVKAWEKACSTGGSTLVIPGGKNYYLKPLTFNGPCKGVTIMNIQGTIKASTKMADYSKDRHQWIKFDSVKDISVLGGGTIDGNGKIWWQKSCKIDKKQPCMTAPTALTFIDCMNVKVEKLKIKNAQQMHLTFHSCENVQVSNVIINAPGNSPNTDGIHVSGTKNMVINQCIIQTGDDCISIVSGSNKITAQNIKCGPGHGISIGSLGKNGAHDVVSNILVDKAIIANTQNGVRIKSWQGGSGIAQNIVFQNIFMHNVTNPIIIDQYYCDKNGKSCSEKKEGVQVKNVLYKNIRGTSAEREGVIFKCSKSFPCQTIKLQDVDLSYKGYSSVATCTSAQVQEMGMVNPACPNLTY